MDKAISAIPTALFSLNDSWNTAALIIVATAGSVKVRSDALPVSILSSPLVYRRKGAAVDTVPSRSMQITMSGPEKHMDARESRTLLFAFCQNLRNVLPPSHRGTGLPPCCLSALRAGSTKAEPRSGGLPFWGRLRLRPQYIVSSACKKGKRQCVSSAPAHTGSRGSAPSLPCRRRTFRPRRTPPPRR